MTIQTYGIGWECPYCGNDNLPEAWRPWSFRDGCVECADRRDREAEEDRERERDNRCPYSEAEIERSQRNIAAVLDIREE